MSLKPYLEAAPKAELHLHIQGAIRPETLLELARRHRVDVPAETVPQLREWFRFRDFGHFVEVFAVLRASLVDPSDYELVTYELGASLAAQTVPEIAYDANADLLKLPDNIHLGEVAGVATNSKGHIFVYSRTGAAHATVGTSRTFYKAGSRLFEFDQTGKFVREIGVGVYGFNNAQAVRIDPQDNIWVVDRG